jgi:hypothetical protein
MGFDRQMSTYSYVNRVVPENWQGWYTRAIMEMGLWGGAGRVSTIKIWAIATQPTQVG